MKAIVCLVAFLLAGSALTTVSFCPRLCEYRPLNKDRCVAVCEKKLPVALTESELAIAGKLDWKRVMTTTTTTVPKLLDQEYAEEDLESAGIWSLILKTAIKVLPIFLREAAEDATTELEIAGAFDWKKLFGIVSKVLPIILSEEPKIDESTDLEISGKINWKNIVNKIVQIVPIILGEMEASGEIESAGKINWKSVAVKGAKIVQVVLSQDEIYIS